MLEDTTDGRRRPPPADASDGFAATEAGTTKVPVSRTRTMFGRYLVIDILGRGGMGEVFAAFDPELDRKIALKRVRIEPRTLDDRRTRLLREAQAMAKIRHPNVLAVFDVGEIDDEVFIAMELVDGETLRAWMQREHELPAIVDAFVQAARGLEAAHALGLVHRDFKPDNAMVDRTGRVQVLDFGLVASTQPTTMLGSADAADSRTHSFVGTPAYMSPEQYAGDRTDARSDQFALCVALFEAIHGTRPFTGDTIGALASSVTSGIVTEPTKHRAVPRWLDRAMRRGLAVDAAARWPSVTELREALERGLATTRRGRKRWLAAAGIGVLGSFAAIRFAPDHSCDDATRPVDDLWNDEVRSAIGSAFAAAPGPLGAATWQSIATRLDARADAWRDGYAEVCAAARDGAPLEVERADRRRVCLHEQTHALDSALEVLAIADGDVIAHAPQMVEALPNPTACSGELPIAAASSLDAPTREQVRRTAALAESLLLANKAALAKERIEERLGVPAIAADPAAAAKLGVLAAGAMRTLGDMQGAAAELDAAYLQARATDSRELMLMAAMEYVAQYAALREPEPARQWIERARVEARALGDERALAVLEGREAQAFAHAGEYVEAIAKANAALAHFDELGLGDAQQAIDVIANRGTFHFSRGEIAEARASKLDALRRQATLVDGEHPMMAKHISDLGLIAMRSGDLDGARQYLERGLELVESAYTEPHPAIGESLAGLGGLAARRGDSEAARGYNERALANLIPTVGEDSAAVALIYNNQGTVLLELGRRLEGIDAHRRATAIKQRILAPDHPDLALSYAILASALVEEGDDAQVEALFRKALVIQSARVEPAPRLATESRMAHWLADRGRADEARELAERVLAEAEATNWDKVHALYALATISTGETRRAHARAALAIEHAGGTKLALALRQLAAHTP